MSDKKPGLFSRLAGAAQNLRKHERHAGQNQLTIRIDGKKYKTIDWSLGGLRVNLPEGTVAKGATVDGEITDGIGHGFARIIYGDTGKSYTGYYDNGVKTGKGIQREKDGTVQAQGIWKGNEQMLRKETINSFKQNLNVILVEREMERQLLKEEKKQ